MERLGMKKANIEAGKKWIESLRLWINRKDTLNRLVRDVANMRLKHLAKTWPAVDYATQRELYARLAGVVIREALSHIEADDTTREGGKALELCENFRETTTGEWFATIRALRGAGHGVTIPADSIWREANAANAILAAVSLAAYGPDQVTTLAVAARYAAKASGPSSYLESDWSKRRDAAARMLEPMLKAMEAAV